MVTKPRIPTDALMTPWRTQLLLHSGSDDKLLLENCVVRVSPSGDCLYNGDSDETARIPIIKVPVYGSSFPPKPYNGGVRAIIGP